MAFSKKKKPEAADRDGYYDGECDTRYGELYILGIFENGALSLS